MILKNLMVTFGNKRINTTPKLVVLDSRTRRWRSEFDIGSPLGLMDWEAMCELQQELIGHNAIVLVSHAGSASTILNIFKHPKTPHHFVILSGDVHYSFVYDIELRFRHFSPKIWQITSSGVKNQFPQPLFA